MIDLEHAAADLVAAGRAEPDVEGVHRRVAKRRRTRRVVGGLTALVLLAGGAAAAASMADEDAAPDAVVTGPGPDGSTGAPDEPTDPWAASQPVDLGGLRVLVPADWQVIDAATHADGACGGSTTVAIGDSPLTVACPEPTALRIAYLREPLDGAGEDPQTRNGIDLVRLDDDPIVWAAPDLDVRLSFGEGVDVEAILGTIGPSARQTALADAASGGVAGWQTDPDGWQEVSYQGIAIQVPADWPVMPGDAIDSQVEPCLEWVVSGPTAIVGPTDLPFCEGDPWRPRDGAWLLPAEGAVETTAGDWEELAPFDLGGDDLAPLVQVGATATVLQVVVDPPGGAPVLVRIGLGNDGHLAGSILSSIRVADDEPEIGAPVPIVLPCGTVVTTNRSALVLPDGLDVPLADGMGGWAEGTGDGICASNLTDPNDPGRHVTFADGPLPYGLAEELGGTATREAGVRWGPIEDGYGAEVTDDDATFHVLAYGIDEEEAAALLSSLASDLDAN